MKPDFYNFSARDGSNTLVAASPEAVSDIENPNDIDPNRIRHFDETEDLIGLEEIKVMAEWAIADITKRRAEKRANEIFEPLFDDAIAKRDKRRIGMLMSHFPNLVERSFVMDRLRNGRDAFPELREGETLDMWRNIKPNDIR